MRVGVVGTGNFNMAQHASVLVRLSEELGLELLLCDRNPEQLKKWQSEYGHFPAYTDTAELIRAADLDAAYVTVGGRVCCEVVLQFLAAGIPVFTEKPPGIVPEETQQLVDAAKNTPHAVGFNRRHSPILRKLMALAEDEIKGAPTCYRCDFFRGRRYDPDFTWTLVHGVDALRCLAGDFASLSARCLRTSGEKPYRNYLVSGVTRGGALVEMAILPVSGISREQYWIVGEGVTVTARLAMPGVREGTGIVLNRGRDEVKTWTEQDLGLADKSDQVRFGFYDQARTFFEGVRTGEKPGTSFAEALQSVEAAYFIGKTDNLRQWADAG